MSETGSSAAGLGRSPAGPGEPVAQGADAASARPLARLFQPAAIAVIGASPDTSKLPGRPLAYLQRFGFAGLVYAVNPKYDQIDGLPCFASIDALPDGVELALIMLPAQAVAGALEACAARGIPFAISVAGGFAEAGARDAQQALAEICARTGIRLVGPNCVGLLNPAAGVTATFSTELRRRMPRPGPVALVTQSGALGNSMLQSFNDLDIGLAAWVSTGNEADLGALDFVEHFVGDPAVRLIGLFVEGLKDGERLVPLARRARAHGQAIAVLRAGRSQLGRAASVSHTGKLAGAWKVWQDAAAQAGIVQVDCLDDLVDLALAYETFGPPQQDRAEGLGVLTISGGLGVLISDACAEHGLALPAFAAQTQAALRSILPPQMAVANPVDTALFTDEKGYATCANAVLDDPSVGTLLLVLTSLAHDYEALAPWLESLGEGARARGKHVALTFLSSSDQLRPETRARLLAAGVLVLPSAERVVGALGRRHAAALGAGPSPAGAQPAPGAAPDLAAGAAAARSPADFIAAAGVPLVRERLCADVESAVAFADEVGYPVVLKIASPDIAHKTEVGGVAVGVADAGAVRDAWRRIVASVAERAPAARIDGLVVQQQVGDGVELIVGGVIDAEIGRALMIGAGGIWAEVLEDVRFLALPAGRDEVAAALGALRIAPLLAGARGRAPMDVAAAVDVIHRLGECFWHNPWVTEVDVNPLIVRPAPHGCVAVDTLVVGGSASRAEHADRAAGSHAGTGRGETDPDLGPDSNSDSDSNPT